MTKETGPAYAVFGPVRSSRLGLSLGLDLLGDRICSFDCLYCESGQTRVHTVTRAPYCPAEQVIGDLRSWLAGNDPSDLDHITLGGAGEPCLNSDLGTIIAEVHRLVPGIPVAVLTNSSLLADQQVRAELAGCDVLLPSLDSLVPEEFWRINRPCVKLDPDEIGEWILQMGQNFSGRIFLEILLVKGCNDSARNLESMRDFCRRLRPERVDVVSMTRPGAYLGQGRVDDEVLTAWRAALEPAAQGPQQPLCSHRARGGKDKKIQDLPQRIIDSLRRRPQTGSQLAFALGAEEDHVTAVVQALLRDGCLTGQEMDGQTYFLIKHSEPE